MKAERFELWCAVNGGTGEPVSRLIRAKSITADQPITDFFESNLDAPEKVGTVEIVGVSGAVTLANCFKEE